MKIKVVTQSKFMQVSFEYNLDSDTPSGIVREMREELNLKDPKEIRSLKKLIQQIIAQVQSSSQSDETSESNKGNPGQTSSRRGSERILLSKVAIPVHQEVQPISSQLPIPSNLGIQSQAKKKLQGKLSRDDLIAQEECRERTSREEEAIIIEERGGAQEHHNQTMDEIYHQNTNDDNGQIQCNVVSNPNNFLNSMILHDKNDLNDPSPNEDIAKQELLSCQVQASKTEMLKREMTNLKLSTGYQYQMQHAPLYEMDESSDSAGDVMHMRDEQDSHQDLQNILIDMFPNYQQTYWNEDHDSPQTNQQQILKSNSVIHVTGGQGSGGNMQDSLDLSHCSLAGGHYCTMHHSSTISAEHSHSNTGTPGNTIQNYVHHYSHWRKDIITPPFIVEDISVIIDKRLQKVSEETKNDNTNNHEHHDHHQEYFLEGMSSLLNIDRNLCANLTILQHCQFMNTPIPQLLTGHSNPAFTGAGATQNHPQTSAFSLSSDSQNQLQLRSGLLHKKKTTGLGISQEQESPENFNSAAQNDPNKQCPSKNIFQKDSDIFNGDGGSNYNCCASETREAMPTPQFQSSKISSRVPMDAEQNQQLVLPFTTSSSSNTGGGTSPLIHQYSSSISNIQHTSSPSHHQAHFYNGIPTMQYPLTQNMSQDQQFQLLNAQLSQQNSNKFKGLNVFPMHVVEGDQLGAKLKNIPLPLSKTKSQYDSRANLSTNVTLVKAPPQGNPGTFVSKQKSVIISHDPCYYMPQLHNIGLQGANNAFSDPTQEQLMKQREDLLNEEKSQQLALKINKCLIDHTQVQYENDSLAFQNAQSISQYNYQCSHNAMFGQQMQSVKLQRRYKEMFKNDIHALQQAFIRIFRVEFTEKKGHFCKLTEQYIKKFQEMNKLSQDGIVDAELWRDIMGEALRTPCNLYHEPGKHNFQTSISYYSSSSDKPNQVNAIGVSEDKTTSTFDMQSTLSIVSPPYHGTPMRDSSEQVHGIPTGLGDYSNDQSRSSRNKNHDEKANQEVICLENEEIRISPTHLPLGSKSTLLDSSSKLSTTRS